MPISPPRVAFALRPRRWWLAAGLAGPVLALAAYDASRVLEAAAARGPRVAEQAQALVRQIERSGTQAELQKLKDINDFFNRRLAFRDDVQTWGMPDYWASPLETLERRAGDCEDYAIAKYFALAGAGVPTARLRMVYVRARLQGQAMPHMVRPVLHVHTPLWQPMVAKLPWQTLPQAPQLFRSVSRLRQVVPHSVWPTAQVHAPATQTWLLPHWVPQLPQLLRFAWRSVQRPLQRPAPEVQ